jgi:hypothetical protein
MFGKIRSLLAVAFALALPATAGAQAVQKSLCVFDPSGANGDIYNVIKDYRAAAVAWGVDFQLKPYTDEKTAAEDFKAGKCDATLITGVRGRAFQKFTGTLEAMGAMPTYSHLEKVVTELARPKAASLMKSGDYEVTGIFPGGSILLFVNDRNIDTVGELAGKRLATLDYDEAAKVLVRQVGASLVAADIGTFAGMFNNGNVDACYAPGTAYKALELYKGIGAKGGVIKYPIAQLTFQLLVRSASFPEGFGQKSREWSAQNFKRVAALAQNAEKNIPAKAWIEIPAADLEKYDQMFQDVRVRLRDQEKVFDAKTLKLMRGVRCQIEGSRAECASQRE